VQRLVIDGFDVEQAASASAARKRVGRMKAMFVEPCGLGWWIVERS
jgi:hypothetical protein